MDRAIFLLDGTVVTITKEGNEEAIIKTHGSVTKAMANLRQVDMEVLPLKEATNSKITIGSQSSMMPHIGTKTPTKTNSSSLINSLIGSISNTNSVLWQVSIIWVKMEVIPQ